MSWINTYQLWLTPAQSLQNAQKVVDYLFTADKDWSKASLSALIGNMRHESSVNPNMYEYGYDWSSDRGFGLVQWTPRSKYWDWALANGFSESELRNGEAQLARIDFEVENNIQWIAVNRIDNLTFKEFRTNSRGLTLNQLTEAFTWGYERPNQQAGEASMPDRQAFALRAFNELDWTGGSTPDPEPEPEEPEEPEESIPDDTPGGIDLAKFIRDFNELINDLLTKDIYHLGTSDYYMNDYVRLMKQLGNSYKLQPNDHFYDIINEKFDEFNQAYIPPPPEEPVDPEEPVEPEEPTDMVKVFPVRIQSGIINFWKRANWGVGTLQRNMTYGIRSNGQWHYGYDIGGGGIHHTLYSVTDGEVMRANFANGIGNRVTIKNDDDQYFMEYGHMASFNVTVGDKVKAGDVIGTMGDTGGNYAIHVDIKIATAMNGFYNESTTIDPEKYLEVNRDNSTTLRQP